jgi:PPK2 family polyphosphate:nucleotide phosphotransferase
MPTLDVDAFRIRHGEKLTLDRRRTLVAAFYRSKEECDRLLGRHVEQLDDLQRMLYAADEQALLLIIQGMDTAGKDGVIRHVMSGVNPQGVQVFSFKRPSATDLDHDFLWREAVCLPERGRIGIFNRSHYEEVVIARVHPEVLRAERVPGARPDDPSLWRQRFHSIVEFERHLHRNGTRVVKVFLHISKDEQRRRLLARIDEPEKNWKFNLTDVEERRHWTSYMRAYEACLAATSRRWAPWYVVPADDKKNARLIASQILIETMLDMKLRYPTVTPARRRELQDIRRQLAK